MKRLLFLTALCASVALLVFAAGCSDSNNSTGPGQVGDTTDPGFQKATGFMQDAQADDAMDNTMELSTTLLNTQFPNWGASSPLRGRLQSTAADTISVIVGNYSYQNGWHIFTFSATVIVGVDTAASLSGIDSVRVRSNGMVLNPPDSTLDELNIRAHLDTVIARGDSATFDGSAFHSMDLTLDQPIDPLTLTINATISQSMMATVDVNSGTDSAATCDVTVSFDQNVNNVVLPMDSTGEPLECPTSGSRTTTATLGVSCNATNSLDSLHIDGTWTVTETVLTNGDIKIDYSDGTTTWSVTEACDPNPPMAVRGWRSLNQLR
ncbi:MAG: hypothetical protein D6800_05035 [Candidatus Zixiibacteriota bacterium]|nr:MAG: hypothetical protein D6800_05035 [candidate division Zixibacteria bacterium]